MLRSIVITIMLLVTIPQHAGFAQHPQQTSDSQSSILEVNGETVRVKLLDAFSGEVISNSEVRVYSDNGIRCFRAPCPTNGKKWKGRSDANGYVVIPTNILQRSTDISTPAYRGGKNLIGGSEQDNDGAWVVELYPNRTFDRSGPFLQHRKLVDAESNKPLINTQVRVSFGAGENFQGQTNSLGYIFFELKKVNFQIGDWVDVTGYKSTKINWGWANYKIKLERQ
jgi:hypothetical protein